MPNLAVSKSLTRSVWSAWHSRGVAGKSDSGNRQQMVLAAFPAPPPETAMSLPRTGSFRGAHGSAFDLKGVLLGINFRQWLGHLKVNVVQSHLPLLDPVSYLDTRVAFLPSLGPGIEFV